MKKICMSLAATALFALAALAAAPITVDALIKNVDKHHDKTVTVVGRVADYSEKTSKRGNPYITFLLRGKSETANVFLQGRLKKSLKNGDQVEVTGTFRKEKKVGERTFKNEIDATAEKSKPDNIKSAKK
ncbi:MAG TPA: OB-fold nucleic acid binding domain-containing protein [Fimbriimonadaceae bacterium]|nr:OB-fold nucleic acid binding domain-containing protein [Fimbriimonadaceae bacterium]